MDVTVQPIERPVEKQEEYYSGAKKHCIKAELQINAENEEIMTGRQSACFVEKGRPHDITLFKTHQIEIDENIEILADSHYQGESYQPQVSYSASTIITTARVKLHGMMQKQNSLHDFLVKAVCFCSERGTRTPDLRVMNPVL